MSNLDNEEHSIEQRTRSCLLLGGNPSARSRTICYDFTPIANHTLGASFLAVRPATSGAINSRGVTGGVYKTRERIHRNIADLRLLVIPTSCTRVAECNPDFTNSFLRFAPPREFASLCTAHCEHVCSPVYKGHDDLTCIPTLPPARRRQYRMSAQLNDGNIQ